MLTSFTDSLRSEVFTLLADNGYVKISPTVVIGDIELEVPNLWESAPENMDLSLVVDGPSTRESALRLYWLVQRLARALDAAESRRTLTVIQVSEPATATDLTKLLEIARVLVVDGSHSTERMIGPLLKLQLPATAENKLNGIDEVSVVVTKMRSHNDLLKIVKSAAGGSKVVNDLYRKYIADSFSSKGVY